MRKFGICTLVLMFGVGVLVLGGCGGSDGAAPSSLQQSAASYMGSSLPSVIDSTTATAFTGLNGVIQSAGDGFFQRFPLAAPGSGGTGTWNEFTLEGDISGTFEHTMTTNHTYSSTRDENTTQLRYKYSDWLDSGNTQNGVMKANGDAYMEIFASDDFDGVVPVRTGVGQHLGHEEMRYVNYNAYAVSDMSRNYLVGGYVSNHFSATDSTGVWERNRSVDLGNNDLLNGIYIGLLGATSDAAYDGSNTTLVASGKYCQEGGGGDDGCFDYEIDLQWSGDVGSMGVNNWPEEGTIKVSTVDAKAMMDFSYTSDPSCYLYSLDADNDNAYEDTSVECEIP